MPPCVVLQQCVVFLLLNATAIQRLKPMHCQTKILRTTVFIATTIQQCTEEDGKWSLL